MKMIAIAFHKRDTTKKAVSLLFVVLQLKIDLLEKIISLMYTTKKQKKSLYRI